MPAQAQLTPPPAPASAPVDAAQAKVLLMRMAARLGEARQFSVTMQASYDVVQNSGQKIEFGETRRIRLSRPDHLRIDLERSDGEKQQVYFDGKDLTVFHPDENVVAKLAKTGTVDDIIRHLNGELRTPIPLSALLLTDLPRELETRVTEVAVVERTSIGGQPVDHLAARTRDVDFQAWITTGDQPVLSRVVLTYKNAVGAPQFRATLNDWDFNPTMAPSAFALTPPADAEAVPFMVPVAAKGAPPVARSKKK